MYHPLSYITPILFLCIFTYLMYLLRGTVTIIYVKKESTK